MRNLTINGDSFYMNGEPHVIISGAMHYFRIPKEYWRDRLTKLFECGFNTVETYTAWNLHEPRENEFDFSGMLDLGAYIDTAREVGLDVIIRPGPYICAEWDFGGLPAWILTKSFPLRCYNEEFLSIVKRYYTALFEVVRPRLAKNGGNVIMLQIENEYGSYGDDKRYMRAVAEIYKELDMDCTYFTSDGPTYSMLTGGALDEYLCVANFGSGAESKIEFMKNYRKNQPVMCGEYWCGWFDHWFEEHHTRTGDEIYRDFEAFLKNRASVNLYMFHGGTNFGFMNGANYSDKYEPTVTSYDYSAPITEAGDRTEVYYGLRDLIKKYTGVSRPISAVESKKAAYGKLVLCECAPLFENLCALSTPAENPTPLFMEQMSQSYGYVLYQTTIKGPRNDWNMKIDTLHDRAIIFVDGQKKGIYDRRIPQTNENTLKLPLKEGEEIELTILVENMGRVNYGPKLLDKKGLSCVRFGNQIHFGWKNYPLPMNNLDLLCYRRIGVGEVFDTPTFFRGYLEIEGTPADTFLELSSFKKGFVTVNGINIGRYYNEAGPQKTLYVPAPFLKEGKNEIVVFESDGSCGSSIEFFDTPML